MSDEPPSRTPSEWAQTRHIQQRLKFRENPPIPPWVITQAIEDGIYTVITPNERAMFQTMAEVHGELHEFKLGVNPKSMDALTICCYCHIEKDDTYCRPYQFRDKYK